VFRQREPCSGVPTGATAGRGRLSERVRELVEQVLDRDRERRFPGVIAYEEFAGRPHFPGAPGWEEVADYALDWAKNPVANV
jgi:hypothetical protein